MYMSILCDVRPGPGNLRRVLDAGPWPSDPDAAELGDTKLPVNDCDCIKFHNALTALCRFCDFPPAGYDLCSYTAVSPVPPGTM